MGGAVWFEAGETLDESGGLGTMGYGLPASVGVQIAQPDALVIDIAGEASVLMKIQEMSTLAQNRLPIKVFILNNRYMGMVRQWQQCCTAPATPRAIRGTPGFVKLAEAYHVVGIRSANKPGHLDGAIRGR